MIGGNEPLHTNQIVGQLITKLVIRDSGNEMHRKVHHQFIIHLI